MAERLGDGEREVRELESKALERLARLREIEGLKDVA